MVSQKFTSKERDAETGLDYFGARYMSSAQGRFTSPDPDNYDARIDQPQAWNMYAYTWNNPLKYRDDDGRAVNLALAGIGAGVGFVTGFAGSAISQEIQNGSVDWGRATAYGAGGAAAGSLAGLTFGGSLVAQALAGAAVGTVGNVANGLISRGIAGEEAFDEDAIESDLANGAIGGALGAGIQFVGTVIKLPVAPKAPSPLGTVRTQLKRMAALRAWQLQRGNLNNRFSAIGGTTGAIYTNSIVQVKTSYDIRQSLIAFGYLDQTAPTQKQKPVKACVETDAVGGGREKTCE
jgi:RHS repeat-associated protein